MIAQKDPGPELPGRFAETFLGLCPAQAKKAWGVAVVTGPILRG
jgi:hypothetical protein